MKTPYNNQNSNAGVRSYEIVDDGIILEFADKKFRYLYNELKPGAKHFNAMKRLALSGQGLTTYINQHVRENYAAKLPIELEQSPKKPS